MSAMTNNTAPLHVKSVTAENNQKTGFLDFDFGDGARKVKLTMKPLTALKALNLMLLRLMQRREEEVVAGLQTFAINKIDAGRTTDGHLYLKYTMENGLGFGTGFERTELEALHQQLSDILGRPSLKSGGAVLQ